MSVLFDASTIAAMFASLMDPFGTGLAASLAGADVDCVAGVIVSFVALGAGSDLGLFGSMGRKRRQPETSSANPAVAVSRRRANIAVSLVGSCPENYFGAGFSCSRIAGSRLRA